MAKEKIILFGGTFDPLHLGHTGVAESAFEQIGSEELIFIPAKCSPLKKCSPIASDADRVAMIELAIKDRPGWRVSDYEIKKDSPSYTIDTVRAFQEKQTGNVLIYWLIGADAIKDLAHWYAIEELIDICNLTVMYRGGFDKPSFENLEDSLGSSRVRKLRENMISTPLIDISSTEIRNRLRKGFEVSDMVDSAVLQYIRDHGLYRES